MERQWQQYLHTLVLLASSQQGEELRETYTHNKFTRIGVILHSMENTQLYNKQEQSSQQKHTSSSRSSTATPETQANSR
jgi:hypothetical protein